MLEFYLRWPTQIWFALAAICVGYTNAEILVFSTKDSHKIEQGFRDLPARFGGLIPPEGIRGLIVYADPPTACQDIKGPPNSSDYDGYNWIVLIARLNCSFEQKIRNAQKAGYDAAIVHNVNSNDLEPMSAKDSTNITIPSVFVSQFTGSFLNNVYSYDEGYFVIINDLPININTHLLLPFAIVVGICFLVMFTFMVVRCIKDRRRARRHRLPNSSLKKIPTHKYTKGDPYETCAICLEDYAENDKLRVLPCAHAYHMKCIDPWLTKNRRVCPVCKRKVFAADERVETDSESDSDGADDSTPLIRDAGRRPTTQGGTFDPQTENWLWRAWQQEHRRRQQERRHRRNSQNSGTSDDTSYDSAVGQADAGAGSSDGDDEAAGGEREINRVEAELETNHANATATNTVFTASDGHSINGWLPRRLRSVLNAYTREVPDIERSVSSTRPHTVNLSVEVESEIHHPSERHAEIAARTGAINSLPTSVVPHNSNDNDVII